MRDVTLVILTLIKCHIRRSLTTSNTSEYIFMFCLLCIVDGCISQVVLFVIRLTKSISDLRVIQIVCGNHHTLALTDGKSLQPVALAMAICLYVCF